ncbi:hypothetical protein [Actinacidiphila sp. bgisy160]|uniref:hypothetical protein n=1 Tax=Actinacidiphila sp. bgisy160 TaxID=3413796 RepID=UPI003D74F1D2
MLVAEALDVLRPVLGEQSGLGLGEDATGDETLEPGADAFDILRQQPEVEGFAQVTGAQGPLFLTGSISAHRSSDKSFL